MGKPDIRFKGYTDEWEQRKLIEVCDYVDYRGKTPTKTENGIFLVTAKNVKDGFIDYETSKEYISENAYEEVMRRGKPEIGDVLITTEAPCGNVAQINKADIALAQRIIKYRGHIGVVDNTYLKYYLLSPEFQKILNAKSSGGTVQGIKGSILHQQKIIYPNYEEQKKIGQHMDSLDHLITLHQRKCDEVKSLKKYMLQKMFPQNEQKVPEIRFEGFTEAWEQRKVSEIAIEKLSNGIMNNQSDDETGVKHINVINMYDTDKIHSEKLTFSNYDEEAVKKCNVEFGDIFLTRSSLKPEGIAEANVLLDSGRFVYDDHLIRLKVNKEKYDPFFVKLNLSGNAFKRQFIVRAKTTAFTTIGQEDISECLGFFPKKEEQQQIGEYFMILDHLITLHQRKCEETKTLKKYMLQKMFPQNGHSVPEIRFSGFTEDWEQRKFADVVDIGSGMDYKHLEEGNIPVYGTGGYLLSVNKALSDDKDAIGIGRKGTIDKPYILRAPFWTVDTLFYCIPKENYDLDFTSCIFQNVDWKKKDESTGVPSLSKVIINNVETATPTMDEQQKIGEYFSNLDHLITLHHRKQNYVLNTLIYAKTTLFITKTS